MVKNVVIVGAGYAGILTAKKLAKKIKSKDVNITIIDKNPFHTMLTELHEVAADRVDEDSIKISLKKVFARRNVDVKLDTVTSIDFDNKSVLGINETYPYDYLVIAAGSKPTFYGVPGAEEFTFKLWSYDDAIILKEHIINTFRRAARVTKETERKRILTFYVVGAGFTGVEMVGELAEYVPILCEKYDIKRSDVTLVNIDALSIPVPNLPEKLSGKVTKRLNKMGVELILNASVTEIGSDFIEFKNNDQITRNSVGTIIWAAGVQSADVTEKTQNDLEIKRGGRIQVDQYLRSTKREEVYVIGDNMYYIAKDEECPVPQMVENCEQSADVAVHNIISTITGKNELEEYKPKFHGVMVCIGGRYGVANVGLSNHLFSLPSFLAMFAKHFINLIYFVQVLGWNKIFNYMKHEFFTIRNRRSFVGGHFSNRTPSFLLVPLRVWLGAVWIFEGVMKIVEGWCKTPHLKEYFGMADGWYDKIINPSTASSIADATSSATSPAAAATTTDVVTKIGHVIMNLDIFGLVKIIFVSGKDLASSSLGDYAFKLDIPSMNWFMNHVVLASDGLQMFMQIFIVVAEILVGLALIGGLFTTPAAGFSLVLQFMFITTTGIYLGTAWMMFAGTAVLIAAGRSFGFDYYVMPVLKKKWKKLPFVRKLYIYND